MEPDPLKLVVIEAVVKKNEEIDRKRQSALANLIANEIMSRIKLK